MFVSFSPISKAHIFDVVMNDLKRNKNFAVEFTRSQHRQLSGFQITNYYICILLLNYWVTNCRWSSDYHVRCAVCVHVITGASTYTDRIFSNIYGSANSRKTFANGTPSSNCSQITNCTTVIVNRRSAKGDIIIINNNEHQTIRGKQDIGLNMKLSTMVSAYHIITIYLPTE